LSENGWDWLELQGIVLKYRRAGDGKFVNVSAGGGGGGGQGGGRMEDPKPLVEGGAPKEDVIVLDITGIHNVSRMDGVDGSDGRRKAYKACRNNNVCTFT
jgi:hypothetical protein